MTTLKKEVLGKFPAEIFVETGTLFGDGVQVAIDLGFKQIFSIEIDKERFEAAGSRFANAVSENRVRFIHGDSSLVFGHILKEVDRKATFWLDSHWDGGVCGVNKCTIYDELEALLLHPIREHSILIDDRRIWGKEHSNWGAKIDESKVIDYLRQINKNYEINYMDGHIPKDILCASLATA